ncbi:TetR family transcriptional regulator, partial [Streptomyces sp. NPDC059455]|uniref:TetR family transcriptional regulator n=1 Tax=Streptomyces sp. NPDC059455 TaxID=3346837 RepID=UPI0036BA0102
MTTAKIARAAGIGEGTIFRVFEDKDTLLAACMAEAVRPDDTVAHLESIALDQPLADRLAEAADVVRGHMGRIGAVAGALAAAGRLERMAPKPGKDGRLPDREASLARPRAGRGARVDTHRG